MDDTPKQFLQEFRSSVLKKNIGTIAIAIVLAQALMQLLAGLTWFLVIPLFATMFLRGSSSVLFKASRESFPIEQLIGSILQFALAVIVVFYLNRWVHKEVEAVAADEDAAPVEPEPQV